MSQTRPPTVAEIVRDLEAMYPPSWAEDWDHVGLICGESDAPVSRMLLAVDPVAAVIDEAVEWNADFVLTHHPLLFQGAHSIATTSAKGRVLHRLIRANCALYAAHTNADVATPGVSDALARVLGMTDLEPLSPDPDEGMLKIVVSAPENAIEAVLEAMGKAGAGQLGSYSHCAFISPGTGTFVPEQGANPFLGSVGQREDVAEKRIEMLVSHGRLQDVREAIMASHPYETPAIDVYELAGWKGHRGIGRIGRLHAPTTLREFAMLVAEALPGTSQGVTVSGDPEAPVQRIAVCGGSGDSLLEAVRRAEVDAYVTSDLRHHPASEAREEVNGERPYLLNVPHWASEWPWLAGVANRLQGRMEAAGTPVQVRVSVRNSDPWNLRVPSPGGIVR